MKVIVAFLSILTFSTMYSQNVILNGNFENWYIDSYHTPNEYVSQIPVTRILFDTANVLRSSDSYDGDYSIRLETKANQIDTFPGIFVSGDNFFDNNGVPYSQKPDSIVGYYKCDIKTNDTALLGLVFTDSGSPVGLEQLTFTGTQSTWKRFESGIFYFPFSTPDSLLIAGFSSGGDITYPGSWIMFDSLHFKGTGITQQVPNGNFENWTEVSYDEPEFWQTANSITSIEDIYSVTKSSDSYSGSSALRLETIEVLEDTIGFITNGEFDINRDTITGGIPFTSLSDTLVGYYKYTPVGIDTAGVGIYFLDNGSVIDSAFTYLFSQSSYTRFNLPFNISQTPDTMLMVIVSSIDDQGVGSVLFIDSLIMNSIVTSLNKESNVIKDLKLYPNPTSESIQLEFEKLNYSLEIEIIDAIGRIYDQMLINTGEMRSIINVQHLKKGTYFLRMKSEQEIIHRSFIKQ